MMAYTTSFQSGIKTKSRFGSTKYYTRIIQDGGSFVQVVLYFEPYFWSLFVIYTFILIMSKSSYVDETHSFTLLINQSTTNVFLLNSSFCNTLQTTFFLCIFVYTLHPEMIQNQKPNLS